MTQIRSRGLGGLKMPISKMCVSPDGKHILASANSNFYILNYLEKRTPKELHYVYDHKDNFAYSPDGSHIVTATSDEFNIAIIELDDSRTKIKNTYPIDMFGGTITSIAYSPNGQYIIAANSDNEICIWDIEKKEQFGDVCDEHKSEVVYISFSADNNLIISISIDNTCIAWDFRTKEKILTFGNTNFTPFAVSPDGHAIAWGNNYESINLLTFESLSTVHEGCDLHEVNRSAKSIAFSPDGSLMAYGGGGDLIYIYKVKSKDTYAILKNKTKNVHSLDFSPDGKSLITASPTEIRIWYFDMSDVNFLFDTVKVKRQKPFDILELREKTPSLNEKNTYDMIFQLDDFSIIISSEDLNKVYSDTSNIKYECKGHVPYTALSIGENDYINEPYLSIRSMGFIRDGLIRINDIKKAVNRYKTYYYPHIKGGARTRSMGSMNSIPKTARRKKCPNGYTRNKQSDKCIKQTGKKVNNLTNLKLKSRSNSNTLKSKEKFSPLKYKRNFNHALIFNLQEDTKVVKRIVSKQVLTIGNVVSADHCQSDLNYQVYKLTEISNKVTNKRKTRSLNLAPLRSTKGDLKVPLGPPFE